MLLTGRCASQRTLPSTSIGWPGAKVWTAFVLALAACSKPGGSSVPIIPVSAQVVARSPLFGKLKFLLVRGSRLWATDAGGDPSLHVIDLATGQIIRSFGRRGDGPGEFHAGWWLWPDPRNPAGVLVYDPELNRVTEMALDSGGRPSVGGIALLQRSPEPMNIAPLGGKYVGWLSDPGPRWMLFELDSSAAAMTDGPLLGPADAPFKQRMFASNNLTICSKPDGSRFAVLYASAGRIELHDSAAKLVGLANVPDSSNGDFANGRAGEGLRWERLRYHYVGCAATDRFFFALFSGHPDPPSGGGFEAERVQVFGWNGALAGDLRLSASVLHLTVDRAGTTLYAPSADGESIYRFAIPTPFGGAGT